MTRYRQGLYLLLLLGLSWFGAAFAHAAELTVKAGDTDIGVQVRPAKGNLIFIWQVNEAGVQTIDHQLMRQLAAQGMETWQLDLLDTYFLANTASNMDRIPAQAFSAVLQAAAKTGKHIIVATSGRGVIPVLRGVRQWQLSHPDNVQLLGTILLSPKLFIKTPAPGQRGKLMPIVRATNQAIVLMQPNKSPWYWKLDQSLAGLRQGGSNIYLWILPGVRDRFYFRPDANAREQQAANRLATKLYTAAQLLVEQGGHARRAVAQLQSAPQTPTTTQGHVLAAYKGDPIPPPLHLPDLQGRMLDLADFKDRVVLVNFWATWCPPCVHEMPSMQRLADHFHGKPFSILGVNMAQDTATVSRFIRQRVHVKFPILLDKDGKALKAWRVFAFPTSYILDKHGRIRYALFGGIEWDTPAVKHKLAALLAE